MKNLFFVSVMFLLASCMSFEASAQYLIGTYSIENKQSGKFVDVKGGSANPGAIIWQFELNYTMAQQFYIVRRAYFDGGYVIQPRIPSNNEMFLTWKMKDPVFVPASSQALTISNSSDIKIVQDIWYNIPPPALESGPQISIQRRHQVWKIIPVENEQGTYFIEAMGTSNRRVLASSSNNSGTDLALVDFSGQDNQKWIITKVPPPGATNLKVVEFYWEPGFLWWGNKIKGKLTWDDISDDENGFKLFITRLGEHSGTSDPIKIPANREQYSFSLPSKHGKDQEHCFRIAAYNNWGTNDDAARACAVASEREKPPTSPPPEPEGINKVLIYNCHSDQQAINVWLRDLSSGNIWVKKGTLSSQWANGSCPVGNPLQLTLENSHNYYIMANDCDDNPNSPVNSCNVLEPFFLKGSDNPNQTYEFRITGTSSTR